MQFQRVQVIINPASGPNTPMLKIMNRVFSKHEIDWDVSITHRTGDGKRRALEAAEKGADLILVYGGDGTVMDVANGVVETGLPLGILRGGTANAIATEFKVSYSLKKTLEQICQGEGEFRTVDLGRVSADRIFMLRADVGIGSLLEEKTDRELKNRIGVLAYLLTMIRALPEPRHFRYTLTIDGKKIRYTGAACVVVNMGSVGTLDLHFGSSIAYDDGLLNVFLADNDILTLLGLAASIVKLTELEKVLHHWAGREITIESDPPQTFSCDGESTGDTPFSIKVLPRALRVFAPK